MIQELEDRQLIEISVQLKKIHELAVRDRRFTVKLHSHLHMYLETILQLLRET
jgi:hypothetical protein